MAAFHIIYNVAGKLETYKPGGAELIEFPLWAEADQEISAEELADGFVVEALLTEPVVVSPQNVDDAEVTTKVTDYDGKIQAIVESVGITWVTAYKLGLPDNLPPFLTTQEAQRKVYINLVAERAAFAALIA